MFHVYRGREDYVFQVTVRCLRILNEPKRNQALLCVLVDDVGPSFTLWVPHSVGQAMQQEGISQQGKCFRLTCGWCGWDYQTRSAGSATSSCLTWQEAVKENMEQLSGKVRNWHFSSLPTWSYQV